MKYEVKEVQQDNLSENGIKYASEEYNSRMISNFVFRFLR